jgi:Subtilase family
VLAGGDMTGAGGHGDTDGNVSIDGHGTEVAALIAGQGIGNGVLGMAPRARILPVRIGNSGTDSLLVVADAIRYAVRHGAQVINMSFGSAAASPAGCDPVLQAAVAYAVERDVIVVAAAGDRALISGPVEPASCAGVLAVGGVEPDGSLWRGSTREPYVSVAAPGDHIAFEGRDGRYSTSAWGTSFSSPLVAGTAALIRSRYPHMPWYEVDQRLIDTAIPAGRPVPNDGYGYGIVDPARAVNASAYRVRAAAPGPVYASFRAWLATPEARALRGQYRPSAQAPDPAASPAAMGRRPARGGTPQAGMTLGEMVTTGMAAVCVFVLVLVLALRISSRRQVTPRTPRTPRTSVNPGFPKASRTLRIPRIPRVPRRRRGRHDRRFLAMATSLDSGLAPPHPGLAPPRPRLGDGWEARAWSFGPEEGGEHGGAPGYGPPAGSGPPPSWADPSGWP